MDWLDLLAVQGTLKSLLQHHSSKASILRLTGAYTERGLGWREVVNNRELTHSYVLGINFQAMSVVKHLPEKLWSREKT